MPHFLNHTPKVKALFRQLIEKQFKKLNWFKKKLTGFKKMNWFE